MPLLELELDDCDITVVAEEDDEDDDEDDEDDDDEEDDDNDDDTPECECEYECGCNTGPLPDGALVTGPSLGAVGSGGRSAISSAIASGFRGCIFNTARRSSKWNVNTCPSTGTGA